MLRVTELINRAIFQKEISRCKKFIFLSPVSVFLLLLKQQKHPTTPLKEFVSREFRRCVG